MHQLIEKDFETKLQKLFAMSQFEIAVRLAKRQLRAGETSNDMLVEIYVAYGNQLYRKKSFDDAIRQYIKTIGFLEPSYVIRKFLDSQRIQNLTDYLQALHDHQLADKHHTTLLLNCYTKVGNYAMLHAAAAVACLHTCLHCTSLACLLACFTSLACFACLLKLLIPLTAAQERRKAQAVCDDGQGLELRPDDRHHGAAQSLRVLACMHAAN